MPDLLGRRNRSDRRGGDTPQFQRAGHATAVLSKALRLAAADHGVTFLLALADDWPRRWYARMGFAPIGLRYGLDSDSGQLRPATGPGPLLLDLSRQREQELFPRRRADELDTDREAFCGLVKRQRDRWLTRDVDRRREGHELGRLLEYDCRRLAWIGLQCPDLDRRLRQRRRDEYVVVIPEGDDSARERVQVVERNVNSAADICCPCS